MSDLSKATTAVNAAAKLADTSIDAAIGAAIGGVKAAAVSDVTSVEKDASGFVSTVVSWFHANKYSLIAVALAALGGFLLAKIL